MPDSVARILTTRIGEAVAEAASRVRERLVLIAPYATRPALRHVVAGVTRDATVLVVTRWNVEDVANGLSDPGIVEDIAHFRRSTVLLHRALHAKLTVVDETVAIIGSANITRPGLGFCEESNIEAAVELRPVPAAVLSFVRFLERLCVRGTPELRAAVEAAAANLSPPHPCNVPEVIDSPRSVEAVWDLSKFPAHRRPESLYQRYQDLGSCLTNEEREAVLEDLAALGVPGGLTEEQFQEFIGLRLLERDDVRAFDEFVAMPRRFGEMTDWVRRHVPELSGDRRGAQRRVQTLLRWLQAFLPHRYQLVQPGRYSERFGRREQ